MLWKMEHLLLRSKCSIFHNILKKFTFQRRPKSRGGTLIFSYIRRLGPFFWGQIFEFQYFWGFSENEYFLGYEHFVDKALVRSKGLKPLLLHLKFLLQM